MMNPVQPQACTILSVKKESRHEWTFRVATDAKPAHGQFMQLSIPMIGEAPISVSAQGDGWLEFTIRYLPEGGRRYPVPAGPLRQRLARRAVP